MKAKFNNLECKVLRTFKGKKTGREIAEVVYPEVKSGAESVYIVWGPKKYRVCVDNLVFSE